MFMVARSSPLAAEGKRFETVMPVEHHPPENITAA
jgi:hypothetical protein